MGRPDFRHARTLIGRLRDRLPEVALRSTFMVGFPGESPRHFERLLADVTRLRLDWVGAFAYSAERGTPAAGLQPRIPLQERERRRRELMTLQREIVRQKNQNRVGDRVAVLIDGSHQGHTRFQAPEIDGKVVPAQPLPAGELRRMKVTGVQDDYDLTAV
jgi:tRNA A37 methylthiotransferase MiaB